MPRKENKHTKAPSKSEVPAEVLCSRNISLDSCQTQELLSCPHCGQLLRFEQIESLCPGCGRQCCPAC